MPLQCISSAYPVLQWHGPSEGRLHPAFPFVLAHANARNSAERNSPDARAFGCSPIVPFCRGKTGKTAVKETNRGDELSTGRQSRASSLFADSFRPRDPIGTRHSSGLIGAASRRLAPVNPKETPGTAFELNGMATNHLPVDLYHVHVAVHKCHAEMHCAVVSPLPACRQFWLRRYPIFSPLVKRMTSWTSRATVQCEKSL
jgi:hypothetical protein